VTMPGGAQYLPPIVTRLLGDASDLIQAFAEAKAAQAAFTKSSTDMGEKVRSSTTKAGRDVDDFTANIVNKMHAGESAAAVLKRRLSEVGDEVVHLRKRLASDSANQGLFVDFKKAGDELSKLRKLAQDIAPDLLKSGRKGGQSFVAGFVESMSTMGEYVIPILIGLFVLASPAIAGLIGAAVTVGLGLGFAGAGVLIAALLVPKIKMQFTAAGNELKKALLYAISGSFLPAVRNAMLEFRSYIKGFGVQFRRIFDGLAPALKPLADALGQGITVFLKTIADAIPQIMPALMTFISTIPMVMKAVADFLVKITSNGPALSRFISDAAYAISGFLESAGDVIAWLEGVYLWVVKVNEKFPFTNWSGDVKWIKGILKDLGDFFTGLWDSIVAGVESVGRWFAGLGKGIWNWIKSIGSAIGGFVTGVLAWFAALPGKISAFFAALPGRIAGFISQMAHRTAYWVGWMVGRWIRFIMDLPGKVLAVITYVWAWTTRKTSEAIAAVIAEVKALPGQIGRFFSMVWTAVTTWVAKTWQSAVLWFGRTKKSIIEHVAAAISAAVAFFKGLPARAGTELKSFKDRVVGFFGDAKKMADRRRQGHRARDHRRGVGHVELGRRQGQILGARHPQGFQRWNRQPFALESVRPRG
jgi:hypothetical protein